IAAFIDQKAGSSQTCLGRPLFSLPECIRVIRVSGMDLLVAVHNRNADMPPLIHHVASCGFSDVLTMIDYANAFRDDEASRYWLSPRSIYLEHEAEIHEFFDLLGDEESRHWVDRILRFRIEGDYSCLPSPDVMNQYVPPDLQPWANPLRLIDCGAFTGDTIELLLARGYDVEEILAFEPDPENYEHLVKKFTDRVRIFIPCGVS